MSDPRTLLLFDPAMQPQSWNERMSPGEFAVLYSSKPFDVPHPSPDTGAPFCTVFATLAEAEQHALRQVAVQPSLRCRIYDHHGLGSQPLREIQGSDFKGESEITPRFRRWGGSILFFGGLALIALDWSKDFRLSWPAMLGTRALIAGLILLVIELGVIAETKVKAHRERKASQTLPHS